MVQAKQAIGVFDSGVGGLSILQEIHHCLACEDLIYVGDIKHAPYGDKSIEFIVQRSVEICQFLVSQNVKAIVIACNTATVSVVQYLRKLFPIEIIGVEPAVKPAAIASRTGQVGVLATARTIQSPQFLALQEQFKHHASFHNVACHGLVEQIEKKQIATPETTALLSQYLTPLLKLNIDGLVLGCTHYPFVTAEISKLIPANVAIFDTAIPVTKQLARRLAELDLLSECKTLGKVEYLSSADTNQASDVMSFLLAKKITVKSLSTSHKARSIL